MGKKECSICKEVKLLLDFYRQNRYSESKGNYTYYNPECKECTKSRSVNWIKSNQDRYKEIREKCENKPKTKLLTRERNKKAREKGLYKAWQRNNANKIKTYREDKKHNRTHKILDQEWQYCKDYFNHECAYCGISEKEAKSSQGHTLHKEHVVHNGANDLSNCIPACRSCNSQKWAYSLEDWYAKDNENYKHFSEERFNKIVRWLNEDYKKFIQRNNIKEEVNDV